MKTSELMDFERNRDFATINSKGQNDNMNKQVAQAKYFVAMAYDVDNVRQSDHLYFIKFRSGRVAGFAGEFETFTYDIENACSAERKSFGEMVLSPRRRVAVDTGNIGGDPVTRLGKMCNRLQEGHQGSNAYRSSLRV